MHILSESIGLYPKMKSKWCYLEHFYEISGIFRPKIAFSRQNYKNSHFLIFLTFFAGLRTKKPPKNQNLKKLYIYFLKDHTKMICTNFWLISPKIVDFYKLFVFIRNAQFCQENAILGLKMPDIS